MSKLIRTKKIHPLRDGFRIRKSKSGLPTSRKSRKKAKEIFIFDETDNNLDKANKEIVKKKIKKLSLKKLMIVMNASR